MHSLDLFSLKYEHILVKSDSICYYFLSRSSQKSYKRVNIIQKPWKAIVIKTSFQQLALKITYWKNFKSICNDRFSTAGKVSKCGVISGPYFPAFGLNMERYFVSLRVQSECRKIRTRNNSVFGHFLCSAGNIKSLNYRCLTSVKPIMVPQSFCKHASVVWIDCQALQR